MNKNIENGIKIYAYDAAEVYANQMFYEKHEKKDEQESSDQKADKQERYERYGINSETDVPVKIDDEKFLSYYKKKAAIPDNTLLRYLCGMDEKGCITLKKNKKNKKRYFTDDFIIMDFENVYKSDGNPNEDKSKKELRKYFYENGVKIYHYKLKGKENENGKYYDCKIDKIIEYRYAYRSPGMAKKGRCVFVKVDGGIWEKTMKFLYMNIFNLDNFDPEKTEKDKKYSYMKIVELMAYGSLTTASAIDFLSVPFENILIVKDKESICNTRDNCVIVKTDENGKCDIEEIKEAKEIKEIKEIKNVLWDGEGLIDDSIFPDDMDSFVYLRNHFFKSCLFRTRIQQFFKDHYGADYETAKVTDIFGNKKFVKDIKIIVTENSIKWYGKFGEYMKSEKDDNEIPSGKQQYKFYKKILTKHYKRFGLGKKDCYFAIVKTGHDSKYGDIQRISYQIMNTLWSDNPDDYIKIAKTSIDYCNKLYLEHSFFMDYLKRTSDYANINDILIDLDKWNADFKRSHFFKEQRSRIIHKFKSFLKEGKLLLPGNNLTLCGSPYELLEYAVKDDKEKEADVIGCFEEEKSMNEDITGIWCYTKRFKDGEHLAGFRSPHNSMNNIGFFINKHVDKLEKYFDLGRNVIVVDNVNTDLQCRFNGCDHDSDSCFVTNQPEIVKIAKKFYKEYPTIINQIPLKGNKNYTDSPSCFSDMDDGIAGAQMSIGESSNLAESALCYYWDDVEKENTIKAALETLDKNSEDYTKKATKLKCCKEEQKELEKIFIICSVLAQCAVDGAKREYDVNIRGELLRLRNLPCMKKDKQYSEFFAEVQKQKGAIVIDLDNEMSLTDSDEEVEKRDEKIKELEKEIDNLKNKMQKKLNCEEKKTEELMKAILKRKQSKKVKDVIKDLLKNDKLKNGNEYGEFRNDYNEFMTKYREWEKLSRKRDIDNLKKEISKEQDEELKNGRIEQLRKKLKDEKRGKKAQRQKIIFRDEIAIYNCPMESIRKVLDDKILDTRRDKDSQTDSLYNSCFFKYMAGRDSNSKQTHKIIHFVDEYKSKIEKLKDNYSDKEEYSKKVTEELDELLSKIKNWKINKDTMMYLINFAFKPKKDNGGIRCQLLKVLYLYAVENNNKDLFLGCFIKKVPQELPETA